jgi:hypothetical protein
VKVPPGKPDVMTLLWLAHEINMGRATMACNRDDFCKGVLRFNLTADGESVLRTVFRSEEAMFDGDRVSIEVGFQLAEAAWVEFGGMMNRFQGEITALEEARERKRTPRLPPAAVPGTPVQAVAQVPTAELARLRAVESAARELFSSTLSVRVEQDSHYPIEPTHHRLTARDRTIVTAQFGDRAFTRLVDQLGLDLERH